MMVFSLTAPKRTIFGRDSRFTAAAEIAQIGSRVVVIRGRSVPWVDKLVADITRLGCILEIVYSTGEPTLEDVRKAVSIARHHKAECVVSIGGGSTLDLGKAVAGLCVSDDDVTAYLELNNASPRQLNDPLPFIAIPTTAGTGAEATRNAVIGACEYQMKVSLRDPRLLPALVIVDPALTDGSSKALTLASGLDAITQLIESYLSNRSNPFTDSLCETNITIAVAALQRLMESENANARDTMARSSFLSGIALSNSGLGIIHGLASIIGARGAAHGAICGRLLPAGLYVNADAMLRRSVDITRIKKVDAWLASGFGAVNKGIDALRNFIDANGLPNLSELGINEPDFDNVAKLSACASSTKANPVVLNHFEICRILQIS